MMIIGIDPGQSGGLALLNAHGQVVHVCKMPETERDIWKTLERYKLDSPMTDVKAYLEWVSAAPKMGVVSAFKFGGGYFGLRMALTGLDIPFELVTPKKWQRFLSLASLKGSHPRNFDKGGDSTEKKNLHKAKAQRLWPNIVITHALADALLIAEYGRRMEHGFGAELP